MLRSNGYVEQITISQSREKNFVAEEYLIIWRKLRSKNCNFKLNQIHADKEQKYKYQNRN